MLPREVTSIRGFSDNLREQGRIVPTDLPVALRPRPRQQCASTAIHPLLMGPRSSRGLINIVHDGSQSPHLLRLRIRHGNTKLLLNLNEKLDRGH
jgi:hypothetical protein